MINDPETNFSIFLKNILYDTFSIRIETVEQLRIKRYNLHFLVKDGEKFFHVKVYRIEEGEDFESKVLKVRYTHKLVKSLLNLGCRLMLPFLQTPTGTTIFTLKDLILDITPHIITNKTQLTPGELGRVLAELHDSLFLISNNIRPGTSRLRFAKIECGLHEMRRILELRYLNFHSNIWKELDSFLSLVTQWWYEHNPVSDPMVIHGDYEHNNVLVDKSGIIYVIDFDCAYLDIKEIDIAHGMLSGACSGYFSGSVDKIALRAFLDGYNYHSKTKLISPHDAARFCTFTILKKICLARNPQNFNLDERLHIVDDILSL